MRGMRATDDRRAAFRIVVARGAGAGDRGAFDLGAARLSFAQSALAQPSGRTSAASACSISRTLSSVRRRTTWLRCCRMRASTCRRRWKWLLLGRYVRARQTDDRRFEASAFAQLYATLAAQRATKVLGHLRAAQPRDGKPQYLRHIPRIWRYLQRSLAHPALESLRGVVRRQRAGAVSGMAARERGRADGCDQINRRCRRRRSCWRPVSARACAPITATFPSRWSPSAASR